MQYLLIDHCMCARTHVHRSDGVIIFIVGITRMFQNPRGCCVCHGKWFPMYRHLNEYVALSQDLTNVICRSLQAMDWPNLGLNWYHKNDFVHKEIAFFVQLIAFLWGGMCLKLTEWQLWNQTRSLTEITKCITCSYALCASRWYTHG